jgi:hypothetical protein
MLLIYAASRVRKQVIILEPHSLKACVLIFVTITPPQSFWEYSSY